MGEERRLAYVALTRGRLRVTVSYCAFHRGHVKVSRFVKDLPAENIVHGWLHMQHDDSVAASFAANRSKRG